MPCGSDSCALNRQATTSGFHIDALLKRVRRKAGAFEVNGPDPSGLIHVKESAIRAGPIKADQSNQSKTAETGDR
jgi:hypothetical protein